MTGLDGVEFVDGKVERLHRVDNGESYQLDKNGISDESVDARISDTNQRPLSHDQARDDPRFAPSVRCRRSVVPDARIGTVANLALVLSRRLPPSFAKQPCPSMKRPGVSHWIQIMDCGA